MTEVRCVISTEASAKIGYAAARKFTPKHDAYAILLEVMAAAYDGTDLSEILKGTMKPGPAISADGSPEDR